MYQLIPDSIVLSWCRDYGSRIGEETIAIHIYSMQDAYLFSIVLGDRSVNPTLHDLPMGPVREAGLRVACIAASTMFMAA